MTVAQKIHLEAPESLMKGGGTTRNLPLLLKLHTDKCYGFKVQRVFSHYVQKQGNGASWWTVGVTAPPGGATTQNFLRPLVPAELLF